MNAKIAQSIAESAHEVIGYDVLVTDRGGTIVGSNDLRRIGGMHSPSLAALKNCTGITTTATEASAQGVKEGYTVPINIAGHSIGTISIAGPSAEVARYGRLVQKQAEIMLREQALLEVSIRKEQALRDLAETVLFYSPEEVGEDTLALRTQSLGFRPEWWHAAALLQFDETVSGDAAVAFLQFIRCRLGPKSLVVTLRNAQISIFLAIGGEAESEGICAELCECLAAKGATASIGVGSAAHSLSELSRSARQARESLAIGRKLAEKDGTRVHTAASLRMEILLSTLPMERKREHVTEILRKLEATEPSGELLRTFLRWCERPFTPARTAAALSIHRNTLQYRMKRIEELTGLQLHDFREAFTLWSAAIVRVLDGDARQDTCPHKAH